MEKEAFKGQGSGLDNIMERATILKADAELDAWPGAGADYQIRIPLKEELILFFKRI